MFPSGRSHRWLRWAVAGYVLVTAGLGFAGLVRQYPGLPVLDYGIRTFLLFSFSGVGVPDGAARSLNPELLAARWLATIFTLIAGTAVLRQILGGHWTAWRLWWARRHVIVCGLGAKGRHLAASLRAEGRRVAAIESITPDPKAATAANEVHALVLHGDATETKVLVRANLRGASDLVAFTGSDRVNVQIALRAAGLARNGRRGFPLRCAVHLASPRTRELLQRSELFPREASCEVHFFNVEELTARLLLTTHLAGPVTLRPHLVVVGFGELGRAVAAQHALLSHYPDVGKPRVTVVTPDPDRDRKLFLARYPYFSLACDVEFAGYDPEAGDLDALPVFHGAPEDEWRAVVVAGDDDVGNLLTALALRQACPDLAAPVYLRLRDDDGLRDLLGATSPPMIPFGQWKEVCSPEIVLGQRLDHLARVLHGRYVREAAAAGAPASSLRRWHELNEDLREANRRQADHHHIKLRSVEAGLRAAAKGEKVSFEFTADELEGLARAEHRRWCAERHLAGWTHGPARDDRRKLHPRLVPWDQLDAANRAKNYESIRLLPHALHEAGSRIERTHSRSTIP